MDRYISLHMVYLLIEKKYYCQTSNISCTLIGNEIVDHPDAVGASPVGAAPNYFFILDLTSGFNGLRKDNRKTRRESFKFCDLVQLILEILWYVKMWMD